MSEHLDSSRNLIADYIGKRVTAELDGSLFDHVPATFRFRFQDPKKLGAHLAEMYQDELGELDALDEDGDWSHETLVPVASVSSIGEDDDEDDEPYEFAWIFLDWGAKSPPGVVVCTTDDWGTERTAKNLAALELKVG